ncbi:MAG: hypothetical protein JWM34_1115 [Ilumatobacteraceae bacterium]|nr:hypothetical protein [Ilumatobacteraceae bacterium]
MTLRRSFRNGLAIIAASFVVMSAHGAAATTPPTTPPTTAAPPAASDANDNGQAGVDTTGDEFVESWALAPAGSADPDQAGNRPELSYTLDPGGSATDSVTLYNFGNVELTFRVYSTDAFNNAQGQFDLLPGDQVPVDAGTWVKLPLENVTVPPKKQVTFPITITVPADAAPGDHAGAILASNSTASTDASGQIVNLDRRTGTRMYIRVNGPLTPDIAVTNVQTDYSQALNPVGGSAKVTFDVVNRGNVRLGGTPTVSVGGPFGLGDSTVILPAIAELLPGQKASLTADLKNVPALFVDSTKVHFKPTANDGTTTGDAGTGTDVTFAPPVSVLIVLIAVIFGLLARRALTRRRRAEEAAIEASHDFESLPYREPQHQ